YYRRDHLGNNREVWVGGNNSTIQHTQYYATGLPWANGTGQDAQQRKYNGKEWIETLLLHDSIVWYARRARDYKQKKDTMLTCNYIAWCAYS
ncbi:MAG: hypothetical protein GX102_14195, partial [Porphyromonadaceae bacterium]|nr:hypothetical protein [Porphyromonadaceae bacterium]